MKLTRMLMAGVAYLMFCTPALGQFISGNDLKRDLEGTGFNEGYGFGFIIGVTDTAGILDYLCLPGGKSGVRAGQVKDVVLKYLRANPENLHKAAADLVYIALADVWPCKKKSEPVPPSSPTNAPAPSSTTPSRPKPKPKEESSPF